MAGFGSSEAKTAICTADVTSITVRGRDLCRDLLGRMSFSAYFYLLVTGTEPTGAQVAMLDALLLAIAEHGLAPSVLAARMTLSAEPAALQGAVAAGILGCGSVILGSSSDCAELLVEGAAAIDRGTPPHDAALAIARRVHEAGAKLPGFGHPLHKPDDPRSVRLLQLAAEHGVAGRHGSFLRVLAAAADEVWGRHLVLNVQGPIAAILLDLGFSTAMTRAIPILARTVSILGHLNEERERPLGFYVTMLANRSVAYDGETAAP